MEIKDRVYLSFANFYPKKFKDHIKQYFIYSGQHKDPAPYLGSSLILSLSVLFLILLLSFGIYTHIKPIYILFAIIGFFLIQLAFYMLLFFKVSDRTERIERVLPDALQLISSNLKAGMTPFQALKAASRDEFGPLKEEIDKATGLSLGTQSFGSALNNISKNTNSEILDRALKLFTTAMESGGHLATLLQELSQDISETRSLKKELVTNTKTYTMFIMFTVIVGTPLLMVVAIHFLTIVSGIQGSSSTSSAFGLDFLAGAITITPEFLTNVAYVMLTLTSIFACMLLGVIQEGKVKYGLKYSPAVIIGTFTIFFIVRYFITTSFG